MNTFKWSFKEPTHPTLEEQAAIREGKKTKEMKEKELVRRLNSAGPKFYFDIKSGIMIFCFSLVMFILSLERMPQLIDENYAGNLILAYLFWVLGSIAILTWMPGLRELGFWKYIPTKEGTYPTELLPENQIDENQ